MAYRTTNGSRPIAQRGLSLIELLVALTIGAFLLTGLVNVFLTSKESAETEGSLARLQENGRFAVDMLKDAVYSAQYLGCNTGETLLNVMAKNVDYVGVRAYSRAADGNWGAVPALSTIMTETNAGGDSVANALARPGSDVLQIQGGDSLGRVLAAPVNSSSTVVQISDNRSCALQQNDRAILAGCLTAHLFEVTDDQSGCDAGSGTANPANLEFDNSGNDVVSFNAIFNNEYDADSEVLEFRDEVWYVGDTGRVRNNTPVYALYRHVAGGAFEEMIEGVEYMRVQFGHRVTDSSGAGQNLRYADPDDAELNAALSSDPAETNLKNIQVVRIALLIQSFESVRDSEDDQTYALLGHEYDSDATDANHSGGYMLRKVFSTAIALRNDR